LVPSPCEGDAVRGRAPHRDEGSGRQAGRGARARSNRKPRPLGAVESEGRVFSAREPAHDPDETPRAAARGRAAFHEEPLHAERAGLQLSVRRVAHQRYRRAPSAIAQKRELIAVPKAQNPRSIFARVERRIGRHRDPQRRKVKARDGADAKSDEGAEDRRHLFSSSSRLLARARLGSFSRARSSI
jgi:hypothetical protein